MQINNATAEGMNQTMFITGMQSGVGTRKGVDIKAVSCPTAGHNTIMIVARARSFSPNQC